MNHDRTDSRIPSVCRPGDITHFVTTRVGGVSRPPYGTLNLGFGTKDNPAHVLENRKILSRSIHVPLGDFVVGKQVHGDRIAIVAESVKGRGAFGYDTALDATDALITDTPGICLMVLLADCVPILFYDPVRRVVGAAHAGWKGTVRLIGRKVVQAMGTSFGCAPSDVLAGIGPSIGPCCYEVGPEVISQVEDDLVDDRNHLNLWEANRRQLMEAGLLAGNIEVAGICTLCNADRFFSERHTSGTGRFGAGIALSR